MRGIFNFQYGHALLGGLLLLGGLFIAFVLTLYLIKGVKIIGRKLDIPDLFVGFTLLGFAVSMPDLWIGLTSAYLKKPMAILESVLQGNNFCVLVIMSVSSIIYPLSIPHDFMRVELPFIFLSITVFFILANDQLLWGMHESTLGFWDGLILLALFSSYMFRIKYINKSKASWAATAFMPDREMQSYTWSTCVKYILFGYAGLFLGTKLMAEGFNIYNMEWRLEDKGFKTVGLSLGLLLPKFIVATVSAYKKEPDLSIATVLGSITFNLLLILGLISTITPITYDSQYNILLYVIAGAMGLFSLFMFTLSKHELDRVEAIILLLLYFAYIAYFMERELNHV